MSVAWDRSIKRPTEDELPTKYPHILDTTYFSDLLFLVRDLD